MSGIFGICEPGQALAAEQLACMADASCLAEETRDLRSGAHDCGLGVARLWAGQQVAELPSVQIAVDADLLCVGSEDVTQQGSVDGQPLAEYLCRRYLERGIDFVSELSGAFALALWDKRFQRLLLAVDRMGIKGLYFRQEAERLLFATRLDALRRAQVQPDEIDRHSVSQYLLFSVVPAPLTIWKGTHKLCPGHIVSFQSGTATQRRYWDLDYCEDRSKSEQQWAQELREQMRASVHRHLSACPERSTGAYLSGGTDSSSVVAFLSERHSPAKAFTISFSEQRYSEIEFAKATVDRFKARLYERCVRPADALTGISKIISFYDEPFGNASAIGSYFCALAARENGIDTLLAGDGGDELFAGNKRYATDKYFQIYHRIPIFARRALVEPLVSLLPQNGSRWGLPSRYIRRAKIRNPQRTYSYSVFYSLPTETIFAPDFLASSPQSGWMDIAQSHFIEGKARSELNRMMYFDLKVILADNDLRKVSGTAELAGVRVRYPLLDYRLAEFSGTIPSKLKLKGFEKRYIFKRAMTGVLPEMVLYKTKHGFGVPLGAWFLQDQELFAFVQDVLHDSRTRQRGYFRNEFFDTLSNLHRHEHPAFYGEVLWYVIALELWHRQHADSVAR